jgi:YidC/Oxa1 family membrane protein insertase
MLSDGVVVQRTYHFRYKSYVFDVSTTVEGLRAPAGSSMTLLWGPGLLQQQDEGKVERRGQTKPLPRSYVSGKIHHKAPEAVGAQETAEGNVTWTALGDTYFTAVLLPQDPPANAAMIRRVGETTTATYEVGVRTPFERGTQTVRVYVGPKAHTILKHVEPSLDKLIDLGFFSPLARPMLQFLIFMNQWFHNYGITIIIVTILIKIAFWPLTVKSFKSMQAMQKLQPKVKELQARYKDDRQRMNQAMMQLYRDEKVNPMGGCLPMLLQIPVFFAFYNALLYSIELRHAPFICWDTSVTWLGRGICDLSVYDPTYITPILMGISMFLQQKMTPTTADPTQAKVMQFMPLIFLLFFLKAPSGLVIYWLLNNVLSIAQQYLSNRMGYRQLAEAGAVTKG